MAKKTKSSFTKKANSLSASALLTNKIMSIKDDFILKIINDVESFLLKNIYLDKEEAILLGVSGGIDSVTMLDIMWLLSDKLGFKLIVGHYNHSLRGKTSDSDEQFVCSLATKYELEYHHSKGKVRQYAQKKSLSIEHSARLLRYMFFERTARTAKANYIATAHTSDDSAETFLLNLIRGSGLTGLSGIPMKRQMGKSLSIIRPLINFEKSDIIEYARRRNLSWIEDESNNLLHYTRNKIRHSLIPLLKSEFNPAIIDILNRTSKILRGADNLIQEKAKDALEQLTYDKKSDGISIKLLLFQTYDTFLQGEIIQSLLLKHFQHHYVNINIIDGILSLCESAVGSVFRINSDILAMRDRNSIVFSRQQVKEQTFELISKISEIKLAEKTLILKEVKKKDVKFKAQSNVEYFDFDLIPMQLIVRNWAPGDTFTPLGMNGSMSVSDFLTNEKISPFERSEILLLSSKNDIIWIIGERISDKFKITDSTTRYLKAELITKQKK